MTLAIETEGLTKHYTLGFLKKRTVRALDALDLKVEQGQVMGLLGPNGAGKSTTIKILLNLIRATSGKAKLFGQDPASPEARQEVGFLPENPAPYEYLTGEEFVTLAGSLGGLTGARLRTRVDQVIQQVEMERARSLQVRKYSKGMIQRISLAQALVTEPKLLILDEPTSGLDVLGRKLVRDIILAERRKGTTVLFCSHIIPDVEALCDRVVVLIGGKLVREGRVSELLSGDQTEVEVVLEGVNDGLLASLGGLGTLEQVAERVSVRCDEASVPKLLQSVLTGSGKVVSLQRSRYSLEALFLDALKQSSQTSVGSEIMNALAALTLNGFREARRNRVTTVVYVFAVVLVFSSTVALDMTVATFDRVMIDLGLGAMTLIAAFLSIFLASGLIPKEIERRTIFMVLAKPLSRTKFILGRFFGNLLTVYVVTLAMGVLLLLQLLAQDVVLHRSLWASMMGIMLQGLVVSAIAFAFAAVSSQFITAVTSVSLYFLGNLTPDLYAMADRSKSEVIKVAGKFLYYVLPNLDRLNFSSRATYRDPVEWSELLGSTTYAVGYAAVMLFIAAALFERRDFK